jgi:hypothetical protein
VDGGESGIRTHGRVSPTHAFQACSFNHSDISPFDSLRSLTAGRFRVNDLRAVCDQIIARRLRLHPFLTSRVHPAVYGPPTAARARKLCQTLQSSPISYRDLAELDPRQAPKRADTTAALVIVGRDVIRADESGLDVR